MIKKISIVNWRVKEYDWRQNELDNNPERTTVIYRLLDNLNSCVDEAQVSESIERLTREIGKIETTSGPSKRTLTMRCEVERLESLLAYSREHARLRQPQAPESNRKIDR